MQTEYRQEIEEILPQNDEQALQMANTQLYKLVDSKLLSRSQVENRAILKTFLICALLAGVLISSAFVFISSVAGVAFSFVTLIMFFVIGGVTLELVNQNDFYREYKKKQKQKLLNLQEAENWFFTESHVKDQKIVVRFCKNARKSENEDKLEFCFSKDEEEKAHECLTELAELAQEGNQRIEEMQGKALVGLGLQSQQKKEQVDLLEEQSLQRRLESNLVSKHK